MIFSLVGFWIIAVLGFVFHGMDEKNSAPQRMAAPPRVADPPKQPHALLRARAPQIVRHPIDLPKYMSPLLIFTCKRADYLKQTLSQVLDYIPKTCKIGCPIIVSQDGYNQEITALIKDFQTRYESVVPIVHLQHEPAEVTGSYKKLAMHYSWALAQTFGGIPSYEYPQPDRLIILEEDLHISPDFFDYFAHMAPILDQDSSLLTVSAFNDNGNEGKVKDATRVLRSDFFPGLGWMMTRKLWDTELSTKWPGGYWDDWLREPQQRQGRHIVRPEVSRTFHFGTKGGASRNQFGDQLSKIYLNTEEVDWSTIDLSYLQGSTFDRSYFSMISMAQLAKDLETALESCKSRDARLEYTLFAQFKLFAQSLHIMNDEKAGIPRTAYRGVVETRPHGDFILFLTPPLEKLKSVFHL